MKNSFVSGKNKNIFFQSEIGKQIDIYFFPSTNNNNVCKTVHVQQNASSTETETFLVPSSGIPGATENAISVEKYIARKIRCISPPALPGLKVLYTIACAPEVEKNFVFSNGKNIARIRDF